MKAISATSLRKDVYNLLESVEQGHEPIQITSKRANAILIGESDWRAIQETLYLLSVPGMRESLLEGKNSSLDECDKELDW